MRFVIKNEELFVKKFMDKYEEIFGDGNLQEFLEQDFGTFGWQDAFDYACDCTYDDELKKYCDALDWQEYDGFSCELSKIILSLLKRQ
jgi:hypothetical protein